MKTIQENLKLFYVGLKDKEPFLYKNKDLTTHAAIIGMTGSGKTGLGITILEEACIDNIPSIIIDPKGDMTNLALAFEEMKAEDFLPYIEESEAQNKGLRVEEFAQNESQTWKKGIENSFQSLERVKTFKDSVELKIYTPKSSAGVGVALLGDFACPYMDNEEEFSEYVSSLASSILSLIGVDNDVNSKEHLLISNIFTHKFKENSDVTLEELIGFIATPPFAKIGVFDVEKFYPSSERMKLAIKINTLLASPDFKAWLNGERLDIGKMLFDKNGKARCNVFTISHLKDSERMFFVTLLLNEIIAWMRKTEGTSSLRAILYMDEIFGFFPPNGNPPSKTPMLTLLKQARAHGLGVILSTQNPVDLDYKGLSNIGTWFIGRLQTAQDKARVIDGMTGISGSDMDKKEIEDLISNLAKRNFLVKNIHEDGLSVISTRWALSYLKGPLSREQISNLMQDKKAQSDSLSQKIKSSKTSAKPIISPQIEQIYASNSDELEGYLYAKAKVRFYDAKKGLDHTKEVSFLYRLDEEQNEIDWSEAAQDIRIATVGEPSGKVSFAQLPAMITNAKDFKAVSKNFKDYVYRNVKLSLFSALGLNSSPSESREEFYLRLSDKCNEILEDETAKLTEKFQKEKAKLEDKLNKALLKLDKEQKEVKSKGLEAAISVGTSIIGAIFGRNLLSRTNLSKVASSAKSANKILKERDDVKLSEQTVAEINADIEALMAKFEEETGKLKEKNDVKNIDINEIEISPKNSDIYDEKVVILWR
ncbi:ATP-binding protein [Campylobacter sp. MOP7]|uniref:ATP-binding protein n=1 Tax=Campylobacter canis TaxID=3378588 RepID=UPI00387E4853